MADAKSIEINGTELNIKDETARTKIEELSSQFKNIVNLKQA